MNTFKGTPDPDQTSPLEVGDVFMFNGTNDNDPNNEALHEVISRDGVYIQFSALPHSTRVDHAINIQSYPFFRVIGRRRTTNQTEPLRPGDWFATGTAVSGVPLVPRVVLSASLESAKLIAVVESATDSYATTQEEVRRFPHFRVLYRAPNAKPDTPATNTQPNEHTFFKIAGMVADHLNARSCSVTPWNILVETENAGTSYEFTLQQGQWFVTSKNEQSYETIVKLMHCLLLLNENEASGPSGPLP